MAPATASRRVSLNYTPYYDYGDSNDSINSQYGPSSMHANIVLHLFGDGSARAIEDSIDPKLYEALVNRAGDDVTPEIR